MNRPSCDPGRRGMVLFELMLALFVFTLVAFSLVLALNAATDAAQERNEIAAVINGLSNQIALLHQGTISSSDKDLPPDGFGIVYHLTIAPEFLKDQKGQPVPGIYRATVTAKWKSGKLDEEREIDELIYQP
jgi:hypothetical protein